MNNIVEVKYSAANSMYAREPKKATAGSASYHLFAEEEKTLLPHCVMPVTFKTEIPSGCFGKIYPRSSLLS